MYRSTSAYYDTPMHGNFMGVMKNRDIPKNADDVLFEINSIYHLRPDLLAYDLYGDADLWWVFAQRNPNTIKDPMYGFVSGVSIRLPTLNVLKQTLGF